MADTRDAKPTNLRRSEGPARRGSRGQTGHRAGRSRLRRHSSSCDEESSRAARLPGPALASHGVKLASERGLQSAGPRGGAARECLRPESQGFRRADRAVATRSRRPHHLPPSIRPRRPKLRSPQHHPPCLQHSLPPRRARMRAVASSKRGGTSKAPRGSWRKPPTRMSPRETSPCMPSGALRSETPPRPGARRSAYSLYRSRYPHGALLPGGRPGPPSRSKWTPTLKRPHSQTARASSLPTRRASGSTRSTSPAGQPPARRGQLPRGAGRLRGRSRLPVRRPRRVLHGLLPAEARRPARSRGHAPRLSRAVPERRPPP